MRGLTLLLAEASPSRFHAALAMAAAAAAAGAAARLFLHGDAVALLGRPHPFEGDTRYAAAGLPTLAQILAEARALGVGLICCQTGLALAGLSAEDLDPGIETGGLVDLFARLGEDRLLVV